MPADYGAAVWEAIYAAGQAHGMVEYGTETMHVLRAEKGYIIVGQDTDGTVTPDDAGLSWAVGKNKADFVGKRSLERASMKAADRKQLVGLRTRDSGTVLEEGAQIAATAGQKPPMELIGHVTSSYASSVLGVSDRARAHRRWPRAAWADAVRAHARRRSRGRSHLTGFLRSHRSADQWLNLRCVVHPAIAATDWLKALAPATALGAARRCSGTRPRGADLGRCVCRGARAARPSRERARPCGSDPMNICCWIRRAARCRRGSSSRPPWPARSSARWPSAPHALVDISHRQFALEISGPHAGAILNGACPLDLDLQRVSDRHVHAHRVRQGRHRAVAHPGGRLPCRGVALVRGLCHRRCSARSRGNSTVSNLPNVSLPGNAQGRADLTEISILNSKTMAKEQSQAQLRAAYAQALAALRTGRAATAERQLRAIQATAPGEVNSLRLLGVALLDQDKVAPTPSRRSNAPSQLRPSSGTRAPTWRAAYRRAGRLEAAREELRRVVEAAPGLEAAWLAYGDVLVDLEKYPDAKVAYERARLADPHCRRIEEARRRSLRRTARRPSSSFGTSSRPTRAMLRRCAASPPSRSPRAALARRERLLRHALKQSAHLPLTWRGLCQALVDLDRLPEAEAAVRQLLKIEPENPKNWVLLGNVCTRLMRQPDALSAFEEAARLNPGEVRLRLSIGHLHKTLGNRRECEAAYKAMPRDRSQLRRGLLEPRRPQELCVQRRRDRGHAEPAAGRGRRRSSTRPSCTSRSDAPSSTRRTTQAAFDHYAAAIAGAARPYPSTSRCSRTRRGACGSSSMRHFFAKRARAGFRIRRRSSSSDLPRSGSTLIEQILASHSQDRRNFRAAERAHHRARVRPRESASTTPTRRACAPLPPGNSRLSAAAISRRRRRYPHGRRHFIDKMPNNFSHVGLIHAMLPHATLIDVRRHPMDCLLQHLQATTLPKASPSATTSTISAATTAAILSLMDHWDAVLPGKVLHLRYEHLVRDPEAHIRRLLDALRAGFRARLPGLPRNQAPGAHRERRAGAPAPVHVGRRLLEAFRGRSSSRCGARSGDCLERFAADD